METREPDLGKDRSQGSSDHVATTELMASLVCVLQWEHVNS